MSPSTTRRQTQPHHHILRCRSRRTQQLRAQFRKANNNPAPQRRRTCNPGPEGDGRLLGLARRRNNRRPSTEELQILRRQGTARRGFGEPTTTPRRESDGHANPDPEETGASHKNFALKLPTLPYFAPVLRKPPVHILQPILELRLRLIAQKPLRLIDR